MKEWTINLAAIGVLAVCIAGISSWMWDADKNRGYEFGYFGEYNRVQHALASMPGVTLTNTWFRNDFSMKELEFELTLDGTPVRLHLSASDPIRKLAGEQLASAMKNRLTVESLGAKRGSF